MALNIEAAQELDDRCKLNDDTSMDNLGVVSNKLSELGAADANLFKVAEDGDHVLPDAAGEQKGIFVHVVHGEAEALEELDAFAHDFNGRRKLEMFELVGDNAYGLEIVGDNDTGDKPLLAALDHPPGDGGHLVLREFGGLSGERRGFGARAVARIRVLKGMG